MKKEISIDDALNATSSEEVQVQNKAKKDAGRPLKGDEKADKRVVVYLTETQMTNVQDHCFRTKQKVSTFIRDTFFQVFDENAEAQQNEIENFIKNISAEKLGDMVKDFLKEGK